MTNRMHLPGDKNGTDNHGERDVVDLVVGECMCNDQRDKSQQKDRMDVEGVYDSSARFAWPEQQLSPCGGGVVHWGLVPVKDDG
jgi:hypothetical protein